MSIYSNTVSAQAIDLGSLNGLLKAVDGVMQSAPNNVPTKNDALKWNGSDWVAAAYDATFDLAVLTFTSVIPSTTVEIGSGIWLNNGSTDFTATYANGPTTYGTVTSTALADPIMMSNGGTGPSPNTTNVSYPLSISNYVFTLNATNGSENVSKTLTYAFVNNRFYGVSSNASLTESQVESLTKELSNLRTKTFTVTATTGQYIYYCYPSRLGDATFTVGGFEGGFTLITDSLSITNPSGFVENYRVYRSENSGLGLTTTVVS